MKTLLSFFYIFIFVSFSASGQGKINLNGKITSKTGFVFNVTIYNTTHKTGTVSNLEGDFSLYVSKLDTISFSCIGYKSFKYTIPDTLQDNNFRVLIALVADTVKIQETIIRPWPVNTTALKEAFLSNKNTEKEVVASYAGFREIDRPQKEPAPTILNPVSFIAQLFSKKRIAQVKMERIRKKLRKGD